MKKIISIILVTALIFSLSANASFKDVNDGYEYKKAVDLLSSLDIIGGYEDGTFRPDSNISRAEFSKIVYFTFEGVIDADDADKSYFDDVSVKSWYTPYINWAYVNKIVGGYGNGKFLPENDVSRQEVVKMLVTCVTDEVLSYPMGYVEEAKKLGLLDGVELGAPTASASRGWVAKMVSNLIFKENRLKPSPAVVSVFGLNQISGKDSEQVAMLAAVYDPMMPSEVKLEEGQVAIRFYAKTADGKAGELVSEKVYDCLVDISDMFGKYLALYLNDEGKLAAANVID